MVRRTADRPVRVRVLARVIVLCSLTSHFTLKVPLFIHLYTWVLANLPLEVTLRWTSIPSRGEYKYSLSLHATGTGMSSGFIGHLPEADLFFYPPADEMLVHRK